MNLGRGFFASKNGVTVISPYGQTWTSQIQPIISLILTTMAYPLKGSWTTRWYRSKASTLVTAGDCLDTDGTDIVSATSSSGGFLGIAKATKAASDATNNRIAVLVPRGRGCTFALDGSGLTSAIEGRAYDYSNATTLGSGTTYKPLRVEKVLSATLAEVSAKDPIA